MPNILEVNLQEATLKEKGWSDRRIAREPADGGAHGRSRNARVGKGKEGESSRKLEQARHVERVFADRVTDLAAAKDPARFPVQVLRIGDVCIGTAPCEVFAETGLEFKKRSPFPNSFMVELNNGSFGYLPTPRHFELGGYETWASTNTVEPQASVKLMDALLEMAAEVKPR